MNALIDADRRDADWIKPHAKLEVWSIAVAVPVDHFGDRQALIQNAEAIAEDLRSLALCNVTTPLDTQSLFFTADLVVEEGQSIGFQLAAVETGVKVIIERWFRRSQS